MKTRVNRRTFLKTSAGAAATFGALTRARSANANGRLLIVDNGEAAAVVVTAGNPRPVAEYAAMELAGHVEKISGVRLPVAREPEIPEGYATRLFIGMTNAAHEMGIDADALKPEEFVMRSAGSDLYIVGAEDDANPLNPRNSKCGTLFGVYELLEQFGVRWLWPGELGTFTPSADTLVIDAVDESIAPRLAFREIAWGRLRSAAIQQDEPSLSEAEEILGFSRNGLVRYGHDLQDYLRRHRMGGMDRKPPTAHRFSGWWEEYGEEHPEWFMMHEDGTRGRPEGWSARHMPICVSNPALHQHLVDELWDGQRPIRLGEVDAKYVCQCEACRAWDGPQDESPPWFAAGFWEPTMASDRYARFWKTIQAMAEARNPGTLVTTYMYYNYFPAPAGEITLNENIYGEFVQWGFAPGHRGEGSLRGGTRGDSPVNFFPMPEEAFEWLKQQWLGWHNTGMRIGYRPNYLHDGWVMPLVSIRQAAEFFQYAVEHGMEGARFDSLTGQWAAHGPKLYVHMRLLAKPELSVEKILDEYYEAFGPAADAVRDYFEYWEAYCIENAERFCELFLDVGMRWQRFPLKGHEAFPPESFEPAEEILERAVQAAAEDPAPEYAARVDFLRKGLEHARLAGRLAAAFDGQRDIPEDTEKFEKALEALRRLVEFRRAHEDLYISDYFYGASWREAGRWNLAPLFARL